MGLPVAKAFIVSNMYSAVSLRSLTAAGLSGSIFFDLDGFSVSLDELSFVFDFGFASLSDFVGFALDDFDFEGFSVFFALFGFG